MGFFHVQIGPRSTVIPWCCGTGSSTRHKVQLKFHKDPSPQHSGGGAESTPPKSVPPFTHNFWIFSISSAVEKYICCGKRNAKQFLSIGVSGELTQRNRGAAGGSTIQDVSCQLIEIPPKGNFQFTTEFKTRSANNSASLVKVKGRFGQGWLPWASKQSNNATTKK